MAESVYKVIEIVGSSGANVGKGGERGDRAGEQ